MLLRVSVRKIALPKDLLFIRGRFILGTTLAAVFEMRCKLLTEIIGTRNPRAGVHFQEMINIKSVVVERVALLQLEIIGKRSEPFQRVRQLPGLF